MKVYMATNNQKKLKELHRILAAAGLGDVSLLATKDLPASYPEPVEDGASFAENALIKARAGAKATGLVTVADDSGIAVAALNGMPGVLSARWCGRHGDDEANNNLLLAQLADVPEGRRDASFVSVCAVVTPDGQEYTAEGVWAGRLAFAPQGENGFGYDPLFIPAEETGPAARTSAQLTPAEKDALSHRQRALTQLVPVFQRLAAQTD